MRAARLSALVLVLVAAGCAREPGSQPHLLLISIDTLSRDALAAFSPDAQPLPAFDEVAAASVRFDQAISAASWTLPAHGSMLTGVYPHRHGAVHRLASLSREVPTLAERLAGAGYGTAAFTDGGFVDAKYGLDRGFARYDDKLASGEPAPAWLPAGGSPPEVRGVDPFGRAIAHLEHRDDAHPHFLFVHTYALHDYYHDRARDRRRAERRERRAAATPERAGADGLAGRAPKRGARAGPSARANLKCLLGDGACTRAQWDRLATLYRNELRRLDGELVRLLAAARESLDDRPLWIVVTSDHGEGLAREGPRHHGGDLHPAVLAVPLLISGPGARPGLASSRVSLIDLTPTLLELAGLEPPAGLDGRSLAPLLAGGLDARLAQRRMADRALHAEEHYYWWRAGRRRSARDPRATPLSVALWRGDWWYIRSLSGERVLRWPPAAGGARAPSESAGDAAPDAARDVAPERTLAELRREARALAATRAVSTVERAKDQELDEQLRSLGYGGGP